MSSVGKAFAVLRGRLTGDKREAKQFLESMSLGEQIERNRTESRVRKKIRSRPYKLGEKVRRLGIK